MGTPRLLALLVNRAQIGVFVVMGRATAPLHLVPPMFLYVQLRDGRKRLILKPLTRKLPTGLALPYQ